MFKSIRIAAISLGISFVSLSAIAGFTTSEYGEGTFNDAGSINNLLNNFLGEGDAMQISLSDLSALATALSSADSFDYSSNTSLYVLDSNNDGKIGKQEFVDMLATISGLNDVNTTGNGKYAQAYADELGNMSTPVSLSSIQTAITTGNTYAVDAPQIVNTSFSFDGEDSSHSSSLDLTDGLGNTLGNTNLINSFSFTLHLGHIKT